MGVRIGCASERVNADILLRLKYLVGTNLVQPSQPEVLSGSSASCSASLASSTAPGLGPSLSPWLLLPTTMFFYRGDGQQAGRTRSSVDRQPRCNERFVLHDTLV